MKSTIKQISKNERQPWEYFEISVLIYDGDPHENNQPPLFFGSSNGFACDYELLLREAELLGREYLERIR